jgi:hypothetical protein
MVQSKYKPGMNMLDFNQFPLTAVGQPQRHRPGSVMGLHHSGDHGFEARVKPECVHLYPGVDPKIWYQVVQEGEYRDEMAGLWIQVKDWVTYVLAKHFDLQARPGMN